MEIGLEMRVMAMATRKIWFVFFPKKTADSSETDEMFLP